MDVDGDGFHLEIILFDKQANDAGFVVEGLALIEDKVADAVADLSATEIFNSLQGVGVVADEDIGTSLYQLMSLLTLTGHGLERVLPAPVERNNDDGGGVCTAQTENTFQERVHRFLTDTGLVWQVGVVLEGEAQRRHEPDMARLRG